jgi:hypothetical protein
VNFFAENPVITPPKFLHLKILLHREFLRAAVSFLFQNVLVPMIAVAAEQRFDPGSLS